MSAPIKSYFIYHGTQRLELKGEQQTTVVFNTIATGLVCFEWAAAQVTKEHTQRIKPQLGGKWDSFILVELSREQYDYLAADEKTRIPRADTVIVLTQQ